MQETPLVSICCITYNHAPFIRKCLDGFLMQKVDFPIEIIIGEDSSGDNTRLICEEYAKKYPDLITLITSEYNIGAVENECRALKAVRGKYIACCEGDDYWIDPYKLQKQVDFLESHPDYSVCFTRYNIQNNNTGEIKPGHAEFLFQGTNIEVDGVDVSMETAMNVWCTQYLTMVCRTDCYDNTLYKRYKYFRDTHQVYHLMLKGKCRIMSFVGGVYCITGDGEHSHRDYISQQQMTLAVDTELWKINNDERWKKLCVRVMQDLIDHYDGSTRKLFIDYAFKIFRYRGGLRKFLKNMKMIITV